MKRTVKRIFGITLCVLFLLSMMPVGILATDPGTLELYCQAPEDWTQCKIYWWDSTVYNPVWPGVDMTLGEDGLWSADIPNDAAAVIFHDGNGMQSPDLALPTDHRVTYDFLAREWTGVGPCPRPVEYFVAGDAALCGVDWVADAPQNQMSVQPDGSYSKTYTGVAAGSYELKVTGGSWDHCWGAYDSDLNYVVTVSYDYSTVEVCFDPVTKQISSYARTIPEEIVDAAYALEPGESLPYTTLLWGRITEIITPYDETNQNITLKILVMGRESKPLVCYRLKGLGTQFLKVGDTVSVEGILRHDVKTDSQTGEVLYSRIEISPCDLVGYSPVSTVELYCQAPESWTQCYFYTWDDEGSSHSGDWPGTLMTKVWDDLWSCEVSRAADHIIFNNGFGDAGDHTADLDIPTDSRILYVVEEQSWEPLFIGDDPDSDGWGPDSLAMVGEGIPGVDTWRPEDPAGDMTEVSDNVYEKILECPAGTSMIFKIAGNDMWDDNWNFGSGEVLLGQKIPLEQGPGSLDMRLSLAEDCILRFVVDLNGMRDGGNATLLIQQASAPVKEYRRLTVIAPDSWHDVHAYTWIPESYGYWPGTAMQKNGDVYEMQIPEEMINLVINGTADNGEIQLTDDIILASNGMNVTITIVEDGRSAVHYGHSGAEGPDSLALAGVGIPGAREWDPADPAGDMLQVSENVYEKTLDVTAGTTIIFKISGNDSWDDRWNFGSSDIFLGRKTLLEAFSAGENMEITVTEDCSLQFTVDLSALRYGGNATLLVERVGPMAHMRPLSVVVPASWVNTYLYTWNPESFGSFPGAAMQEVEGIHRAYISSELENLVISGSRADGTCLQTGDIHLETGVRPVIVMVREDGTYNVIYDNNPNDGDAYRVVGNAEWMGLWDSASDAGLMNEITFGSYEKRFKNVQPGSYEFKITRNGVWDDAIGKTDVGNFAFEVTEISDVIVTCVFDTGDALVSCQIIPLDLGDVTGDGKLNIGDAARLYAHIRGTNLLDVSALTGADFNGDGSINIGDTAALYAHIRTTFRPLP